METKSGPYKVAIIGAGAQGLAMLKNLLDLNTPGSQLFDPVVLESRDVVGGLWSYTDDPGVLTTLKSTLGNVSRWGNCFADFPVTEAWKIAQQKGDIHAQSKVGDPFLDQHGVPIYLNAAQFSMYLQLYAEKFDLLPHIKFQCFVDSVERDTSQNKWRLHFKRKTASSSVDVEEFFDKIVVATGAMESPYIPRINQLDMFKGKVLHSMSFKDPAAFDGKRVLIVGFSNTAADTSTALAGHAEQVYLSHRKGNIVFPRIVNHLPLDLQLSHRLFTITSAVTKISPIRGQRIFDSLMLSLCSAAFEGRLKPEWRFEPAPSIIEQTPIISEHLVEELEKGTIKSVYGISKVTGANTVELVDGSEVEVDAIIFCTGYETATKLKTPVEFMGDPLLPRLYQNIFHPDHPDSLAYMSYWEIPTGVAGFGDLIAMAIAQVFAGTYKLPARDRMELGIQQFHSNLLMLLPLGFRHECQSRMARQILTNESSWRTFLHDVAGTGINEYLGFGPRAWWYWLTNIRFCNMLMGGVNSPHMFRFFPTREGGPKRWDGAKTAIEQANAEVNFFMRRHKLEVQSKKTV